MLQKLPDFLKYILEKATATLKLSTVIPIKLQRVVCGKTFSWKSRLFKHMNEEHLKNEIHKCNICDKTHASKEAMMNHIRNLHKQSKRQYF